MSKSSVQDEMRTVQFPTSVTMPSEHILRLVSYFNDEHPGYLHTVLDNLMVNGLGCLDEDECQTLTHFLFFLREMPYAYHLEES